MSIIVMGMEMPESCDKCRFCVNGFTDDAPMYECAVLSYDNVSVLVDHSGKPFDFRPDWCSLVEIPTPHGRLVDADALTVELMDSDLDHLQRDDWKEVIQIVSDAKVVIEAEGETDGR